MSLEAYFFTCVFHDKVCSSSKQRAMKLYQEERRKAPEKTVMNAKLYFSKSGTEQVNSSDRASVMYTGSPWIVPRLGHSQDFRCFLLFLHWNAEYYLNLGFDCFLPRPFQSVTHNHTVTISISHKFWHSHQMNYKRGKNNVQGDENFMWVNSDTSIDLCPLECEDR